MAGESDARRKKILKDLTEQSWTLKELVQRYGAGESSIKHDIISLRKQGYQILGGGKKGYRLLSDVESEEEPVFFESNRRDNLSKLTLLLILQQEKRPLTVRELLDRYIRNVYNGMPEDVDKTGKQLQERLVRTLIPAMLNDKLIVEKENGTYMISEQAPVTLPLMAEDAYDILDQLHYFGPAHPFAKDLRSVEEKLSIALTDDSNPERDNTYRMTGKKELEDAKVQSFMELLKDVPLRDHTVQVTYQTRDGGKKTMEMYPGLLCYVTDKNQLFLMGKDMNEKDMVLRCDRIEAMTPGEAENRWYQSPYFQKMQEEMFSISTEPVQHVVVEFDNMFSIRDKIGRMMQHRSHATLRRSGDVLIYEDEIRGMEDFAKYLRQYGQSARVRSPENLRRIMLRSAERTLERYKEVNS